MQCKWSSFATFVAASASLLCLASPALAQRGGDRDACLNGPAIEARIPACTRLLSGNLPPADRVQAYLQRGRAHNLIRGDFARGIADAGEAIHIDPNSAPAYGLRGSSLAYTGKLDAALADLNRGMQLNPENGGVRQGFGIYFTAKGDYQRALAELDEAVRLLPRFSGVFRARGDAYEKSGEINKALDDYRHAVSLDPAVALLPTREAAAGVARLEQKVAAFGQDWSRCFSGPVSDDKLAACSRMIETGKLRVGDLAQAHLIRANGLVALRADCDHAVRDFSEAIRLNQKLVGAHAVRGICHARKGHLDRALADLNTARKLNPNHFGMHNGFGYYYNTIGDYDRALAALNEAIGINPQFAAAYRNRGLAREKKGEFAAALADYRTALNISSESRFAGVREAQEAVARIEARLAAGPAQPADASPRAPQAVAAAIPALAVVPGKRVALIIGNDRYEKLPQLQKAVNDARAVAERVRSLGFEVIQAENVTRRLMNEAVTELSGKIGRGDTAFVFFAGHGVAIKDSNFLLPVDTPQAKDGQEGLIAREGIAADGIIDALQERGAKVTVMVLDACRDNPFKRAGTRSVGGGRGLGETRTPEGVFVLYSAGIGQSALDRLSDADSNPNSVFTRIFVQLLGQPKLSLQEIAKATQTEVKKLATSVKHTQMPAYYDQIDGALALAQ